MKSTDTPSFVSTPFAASGDRNVIPIASQIGIKDGAASFTDGFPPLTRTPLLVGGKAPSGLDMNGILYDITVLQKWQNAGGIPKFDSVYAASIGGYPKGAVLQTKLETGWWVSTINDNQNDPDAGGAGWLQLGEVLWKYVDSGYTAKPGDRIYLNNRVDSPSLLLPASPKPGQEVQVMPYPFTKYSQFNLAVSGNGNRIMGLDETMNVDQDNIMFACRYISQAVGWLVEKIGTQGNSFTLTSSTGAYGAGSAQQFDARILKGAPMLMMVHGGGWISGSRTADSLAGGQYVATFPDKYGISFSSIDYSLATSAVHTYPQAVNDVIAAALYFKSLGVKSLHILGASSGANLAALAVIARPDLFDSFSGFYGAYDLTKTAQFSADVQTDITWFTTDTTAASPTRNAGVWKTPTLLVHGDADTTVNVQQSIDFGAAIGVTPTIVAGANHGFKPFGETNAALPDYGKAVFQLIDKVTRQ